MNNPIFVSIFSHNNCLHLDIVNENIDDSASILVMEKTLPYTIMCAGFREKAKEIAKVLSCEIQDDL